MDPIAEQTMTPYQYVNQNPINLIDPTGMSAEGPGDGVATVQLDEAVITGRRKRGFFGRIVNGIKSAGRWVGTKLSNSEFGKGMDGMSSLSNQAGITSRDRMESAMHPYMDDFMNAIPNSGISTAEGMINMGSAVGKYALFGPAGLFIDTPTVDFSDYKIGYNNESFGQGAELFLGVTLMGSLAEAAILGRSAVTIGNSAARTSANILKPLGRGSTGRTVANNLTEQLAMKEIMSNPSAGQIIKKSLSDPRWQGWTKMSNKTAHGVEIHFNALWENGVIKSIDDFKFISP